MFVVALTALATGVTTEQEAPVIAADLGIGAYEAGLLLRAGQPTLALRTPDRERAVELLAKLRSRGHQAVAFDAAAVVDAEAMITPRSFRFEADAFVAGDARLPYAEISALVRATHQTRSEAIEKTKERKMSIGRAALSGGLLTTKKIEKERVVHQETREGVVYAFRRGGTPWLLATTKLRYEALGPELRPAQHENFEVTIGKLRAASGAPWDDRLVKQRASADKSNAPAIDLLAHVVAMTIAR